MACVKEAMEPLTFSVHTFTEVKMSNIFDFFYRNKNFFHNGNGGHILKV